MSRWLAAGLFFPVLSAAMAEAAPLHFLGIADPDDTSPCP